jgi:hypothetical protein
MFGTISRWLRRRPADEAAGRYVLPSDDPEVSPITVADESAELLPAEIEPLSEPAGPPQPAVAAVQDGLAELASQVRTLGQRVQAQAMTNARLLEALQALPAALRGAIPGGAEHAQALGALRDAIAENAANNARLCEGLAPLKQLADLPARAGEQVSALQQVARHQRRQLKQQVVALRAGKAALESQRKHYAEIETTNQARLAAMQHESAQNFFKLEQNLRRGSRMQLAATCAAIVLALAALAGAAFAWTPSKEGAEPARHAEKKRSIPRDTLVQK